jgi:hypothetical protein
LTGPAARPAVQAAAKTTAKATRNAASSAAGGTWCRIGGGAEAEGAVVGTADVVDT